MIITLNKDPLDLTLEREENLEELISGLSEWLNKEGYEITGLVQDGIELDIYDKSWNRTTLDSVELLDITAVPGHEKYFADLQTLYQYVTLLHDSLKKENRSLTEDLLKDISIITGSLDFFFGKNNKQSQESIQLLEFVNNHNTDSFINFLISISAILQNRINEITSPFTELKKASDALSKLLPDITEISVLLQTGNDKRAMDSVLRFIELSEKLIRIFRFLKFSASIDITEKTIEKESFTDFYKEFNGILSELVEAFNINDSILIGDLMEYEVVPKINRLLEYVNLIKTKQE